MEYNQRRTDILEYLNTLQDRGFSYQSMCDFINQEQTDFVLFKDFFSRFKAKPRYFASLAKKEKLSTIHQLLHRFYLQNIDESYTINSLLRKLIEDASTAKFEAYLEVNRKPKSRLALKDYYLENSSAYLEIENNLKHKQQYQWQLDILNHGSTFKILSIQTINLFNQNAVISTNEFWKFCWVDSLHRKLQFKYETLGFVTYLLSKDEQGQWKIMEDMSKQQINKIEPTYIDYSHLAELISNDWEENKRVVINFLGEDDLLPAIEFIKLLLSGKIPPDQTAILNRIKESCLNSYRLLNTDIINFVVYNSEQALLKKQLKLIIDSIFLRNR